MVSRDTPVPPSRQIANAIREQITAGELPPGTRVPSILALAAKWEVSPDTARKAIRALRAEGLIEVVPGYGTFVRES
jgi:DNA-binding GntR family transcriptional regulator